MTTTLPYPTAGPAVDVVYLPQDDSRLLVDAMSASGLARHRRVLDLCCGSGIAAIAAAELGAASVTAFDICPHAVRYARVNAHHAGVDIYVREDSWTAAHACAPFDLIVCNPPYVPAVPKAQPVAQAAPPWTWNGGRDGRQVVGPLCESVSELLSDGGTMLLVQSEFAGVASSLNALRSSGLGARVIAVQSIRFGPVLAAQTPWLTANGLLRPGCREEQLVVIRADKP